MLAEVKVTNKDLAYIHLNQRASLLLDAFPYQRFGKLYGKVMAISPSSMEDDEGNTFYVVRIKPDQFYLESKDGERHNLRSGMTVTADIITRDKNILSIFTEPLQLKLDRAFRDPSTRV